MEACFDEFLKKSIYSILILAILLYKVTFCLPLIISLILLRIVLLSKTFLKHFYKLLM